MNKFRGFISVDIEICPEIEDLKKEIQNTGANVKIVDTENIHLTLKFLGDTEENKIEQIEEIIKETVKNKKPFKVNLKSTGVFPNENYIKVLWIGVQPGEKLKEIAHELNERLNNIGFKKDKREFSPHLTICRVRSARNKDKLLDILEKYRDKKFMEVDVDCIKLKKSELTKKGPIYKTLKKIKL